MRPEALAELGAVMRGVPVGTAGTPGTLNSVPPQKCPSFQVFQVLQVEQDERLKAQYGLGTLAEAFALAERASIAIMDGGVPEAYGDAWALFQIRKPANISGADWYRAVDDAGQFLDEWAGLALDFGWQPSDIFGSDGLAWFCAGERVRALGPDNAITSDERVLKRPTLAAAKQGMIKRRKWPAIDMATMRISREAHLENGG